MTSQAASIHSTVWGLSISIPIGAPPYADTSPIIIHDNLSHKFGWPKPNQIVFLVLFPIFCYIDSGCSSQSLSPSVSALHYFHTAGTT